MAKRASEQPPPVACVLRKLGACGEAVRWSHRYGNDWAMAWRECKRLDWLYYIPISTRLPIGRRSDALDEADLRGYRAAEISCDFVHSDDERSGPKSCAAYRKHVKWGKHIKPVLREMGWL